MEKLLVLQDRDSRCDAIQRQLEAIPGEIAGEQAAIRAVQEHLAAAEKDLKQLEARRLELEGEVEQAEAAIFRYKTQQLQVKKNEEYTALEHQIAEQKQLISNTEDAELQLLDQIDLKKAALAEHRAKATHERETLEAHITRLHANQASFAAELAEARKVVHECEAGFDAGILQQYRYVKKQVKRPPVVVALHDGRCQGCHLKVSSDIDSAARKGTELVRCDSCGRILYFVK